MYLAYPHSGGITVTDSQGLSPYSMCRLNRQQLVPDSIVIPLMSRTLISGIIAQLHFVVKNFL